MKVAPVLGLDIGSVSVSLVSLDPDGEVSYCDYRFHRGMVRETLLAMLKTLTPGVVKAIVCTSSGPRIVPKARIVDTQVCFIEAARTHHGLIRSLLVVGGEKFALLRFDSGGRFRNLRASTSCAAGTGSFLDQQAGRLGLSGSAELGRLAQRSQGEPPQIASRCAVFAKTDLCHAQQAGYSLEEICDGLCLGLARNIADTISTEQQIPSPTVFAGGVSRNRAVVAHLEKLLDCSFTVAEDSHLYGALGAALCGLRDGSGPEISFDSPAELLDLRRETRSYYYQPLDLKLSTYPDFDGDGHTLFTPSVDGFSLPVEVDIYKNLTSDQTVETILGIDVGSTSTKAVLIDAEKRVLVGLYTRTAGRPLAAVQAIFQVLTAVLGSRANGMKIRGVGTTGAGRKFIGKVIGADLILNEITAHARAALELDPRIDTIIEIGGQDSKFTSLRGGMVTFSQMNTVCAAGTGSFIEEQAARLGVTLEEYSRRAEGVRAPLASDRCTVFMERDINHYLNKKHSVEEVLAAVLFSVRENYLLKVSSEGLIGQRVCFQGATAKNRALVAAFEQKLQQPIFVSEYCHLTGALGVALAVREDPPSSSSFHGLDLYRESIPVRGETCSLCANHCRLRIARVRGQTVAYGFLCGRDYQVKRYISNNRSGFDLNKEYHSCFQEPPPLPERHASPTVGIPAALHLFEELPLWKTFFSELGIRITTSQGYTRALKEGKKLTGAEFCAPITVLHGHAHHLAASCDFLFLPVYLQAASAHRRRGRLCYYCYYTQFASSLIGMLKDRDLESKTLLPLVDHGSFEAAPLELRSCRRRTKQELWKVLQRLPDVEVSFTKVSRAYDRALALYREGRRKLRQVYPGTLPGNGEIQVVLAGRPYQVLAAEMNKGIPDIFASLGIKTYYQDMLPPLFDHPSTERSSASSIPADGTAAEIRQALKAVRSLLDAVHWHYAARILETAAYCAVSEGLYPVLITAFKCSPDSIIIEYFKRILDSRGKPYLILQIDEHDSSVGYETRIEAGIHSFRNHASRLHAHGVTAGAATGAAAGAAQRPVSPRLEQSLRGRTLLLPNWDSLTVPILAAALRSAGVDARALEEDELTIQEGSRFNSGQCLPINAIVQSLVRYVGKHRLDPARTHLWMMKSDWACNLHLFPHYMKSLLERYGGGLEQVGVYLGDLSHTEIAPRLGIDAYFAYLFGGLLRRLGCRIRPYETDPGRTDRTIAAAQAIFIDSFDSSPGNRSREDALATVIRMFSEIPRSEGMRPKVAIFGDFYVRDNEVMNQDLIRFIESQGAEVVTTPFSEYLRITASAVFKRWMREQHYLRLAKYRGLLALVKMLENRFFSDFQELIDPGTPFRDAHPEQKLGRFNVRLEHHGESWDNLLKIAHLVEVHPDLRLFVQTNPAFCCPSLVTEAMTQRIEELTGVPVVTLTYDGTGSFKNDRIVPYLAGLNGSPGEVAVPEILRATR